MKNLLSFIVLHPYFASEGVELKESITAIDWIKSKNELIIDILQKTEAEEFFNQCNNHKDFPFVINIAFRRRTIWRDVFENCRVQHTEGNKYIISFSRSSHCN